MNKTNQMNQINPRGSPVPPVSIGSADLGRFGGEFKRFP
jgi:hypothetical protein